MTSRDGPEHKYWQAAISTLPTREKRDAAWRFYIENFIDAGTGDLLGGLLLLMEAHNCFLVSVPQKFQETLLKPLTETATCVKGELIQTQKARADVLSGLEKLRELASHVAQLNTNGASRMESILNGAFDSMNVKQLGRTFSDELESNSLSKFRHSVENLLQNTDKIKKATETARATVEAGIKIRRRTVVLLTSLSCCFLLGTLFLYGWWSLKAAYKRDFIAAIAVQKYVLSRNQEAVRELSALGMTISISKAYKGGELVPEHYFLLLEGAKETGYLKDDGVQKGYLYFRSRFEEAVSESIRSYSILKEESEKLQRSVDELSEKRKEGKR